MTDHRHALVGDVGRRRHRKAPWLLVAGAFMIVISPVVLFAGAGNPPCQAAINDAAARRVPARGSRPRTARRGTP